MKFVKVFTLTLVIPFMAWAQTEAQNIVETEAVQVDQELNQLYEKQIEAEKLIHSKARAQSQAASQNPPTQTPSMVQAPMDQQTNPAQVSAQSQANETQIYE